MPGTKARSAGLTRRFRRDLIGMFLPRVENKTTVIEFFSDGRGSFVASQGMTWVILEDGRVKIEVISMGMTSVMTGRVDGNILRLEESGVTVEFRKLSS